MTTEPIQSGVATFAPRARLLRLIGAELISDEVVAITELVKNAHDADASTVTIQFLGVTGDDGEIHVRDDGTGMDLEILLERWMQPASSDKGRAGKRFTTRGRRLLGEKGVGRFAVDKLAVQLELVSRRPSSTTELHAHFNWDEFENDGKMLGDVQSRWEIRRPDYLEGTGTLLRMTRLRTRWDERMFRRLSTRLARLVSPVGAPANFKIRIESDEFPRYHGDVAAGFLDDAPYKIEAEFDGLSTMTCKVKGGSTFKRELTGAEALQCGPVKARIFAFDLETESLARIGPRTEVRAWLREWSGISVYRDAFRVWPYGEPHDDWLRLDQRRVNNPVVKLSNNQVVGFIEISADKNAALRDQTNREGLINNEAFVDLRRFVHDCLGILETQRQSLRHPDSRRANRPAGGVVKTQTDSLADTLERLASSSSNGISADLRKAAVKARETADLEATSRRKLLHGYSELAACGHSAAVIGRSVSLALAQLHSTLDRVRSAIGTKRFEDVGLALRELVADEEVISLAGEQLAGFALTGPVAARRRRGLDIAAELRRLAMILRPSMQEIGAAMEIDAPDGLLHRTEMRPETFSTVVTALVQNAFEWKDPRRPLKISARVRSTEENVELTIADNGKGVAPHLHDVLFEPGTTGKDDGAGMGLTLVRNIVEEHGGTVETIIDGRRKGATFRVLLSRKKSRSTARI